MRRLRTTNAPQWGPSPELINPRGDRETRCSWGQTKGVDGEGHRHLTVEIIRPGEGRSSEDLLAQRLETFVETDRESRRSDQGSVLLENFTEAKEPMPQAFWAIPEEKESLFVWDSIRTVHLVAPGRDRVVHIEFSANEVKTLWKSKPDLGFMKSEVAAVLMEVLGKIE